jgi:hypothetical protein
LLIFYAYVARAAPRSDRRGDRDRRADTRGGGAVRLRRPSGRIREALQPDGRLVLLEYRKEDLNVPIRLEHKLIFTRQ